MEFLLSAFGPAPEALPPVDVEPKRAWSAGREKAAVAAHQAVAVAALRLEAARSMEEQLRALAEQQRTEEAELGDWTRLSGDLGRQGAASG